MTIYAKQVASEYQESPLFIDTLFPENIILTGNTHFNSHTIPEYDYIVKYLPQIAEDWESTQDTIAEVLQGWKCERSDGQPWTEKQLEAWTGVLKRECVDDGAGILSALYLITGKQWTTTILHGLCPGDWQCMYYPINDWSREAIDTFEIEYFNMGTEWIIHDGDDTPEAPDDINGYSVYCINTDVDKIRGEIANIAGVTPENVVMYAFDGWTRFAKYKEVATA